MNFDITQILMFAIPAIVAITFHEAAHGYVANYFGDDTAKKAGRLTLNPVKHVDPFGTIILPLILFLSSGGRIIFGYAKPVPVNFSQLKNPRWNMLLVAFAGPAMNIVLAVVSAILLRIAFSAGGIDNTVLTDLLKRSIGLNALLAIFNMLPVPPLDGSKVIAPLLPYSIARPYLALEPFGMVILLLLIFVVPMLGARSGMNFDFFGALVFGPAEVLITAIYTLVGVQ